MICHVPMPDESGNRIERSGSGMMRLRFRGEGTELAVDFEKAEDCRVVLAALADYFGRSVAPLAVETPQSHPVPSVALAASPPVAVAPSPQRKSAMRSRHAMVADWMAKQGRMVTPPQIMEAFSEEWPSPAACSQFLLKWIAHDDCPIERVGRGYYRAKHGGGAPTAAPAFRVAGGDEPAAGAESDPGEVGASCE